jgi:hypothetical protein
LPGAPRTAAGDRAALAAYASQFGSEVVTRLLRLAPENLARIPAASASEAALTLTASAHQSSTEIRSSIGQLQAVLEKNREEALAIANARGPSSSSPPSAEAGAAVAATPVSATLGASGAPRSEAPISDEAVRSRIYRSRVAQTGELPRTQLEAEQKVYASGIAAEEQKWRRAGRQADLPTLMMAGQEALIRYRDRIGGNGGAN